MSVFINPLVEIVKILLVPVSRHIGYLVKSKEKVCDLEVETCRLKDKRADFMAGVEVEKINGKVLTKEAVVPKSTRFGSPSRPSARQACGKETSRYNDSKCCFGGLCPNCPSNYKLSRRAAKKRIRVTAHIDVADSVQWTMAAPPSLGREMPARTITGQYTFKKNLTEILNCLNNDELRMIAVHGMGGVGKTTLMHHNSIARQIGLELNVEDEETVAEILFVSLNRQRFMLILDDMWDLLDIDRIRVPRPNAQNRCKIIITTRQLAICNLMETDKIIKLDVLQKGDAWDLFRHKAREVVDLPNIEPCAHEIVGECSGLPLAIITVGCAMKGKSSVQVWENALRALHEASPEIEGMERQVFSSLKYSYERLERDNIKSCFLYCSLFPGDYEIEKDELVQYWICEGLIGGVDSIEDARNKGHALIESLIDSCMVERVPGDDTLVMLHDVIRDLAIWISSSSGEVGKFVVEAGLGLKEARKGREWKDAERISLFLNEIERLPNRLECSHDPTLILQQNKTLVNIPDGFFECMVALKVVDLSLTSIRSLPCEGLVDIPPLGQLRQLQVLKLSDTAIKRLPQRLEELENLKHLDLSGTRYLQIVEGGVISRLTCLEEIDLYKSGYWYWKVEGEEGSENASWEELERSRNLNTLGVSINNSRILDKPNALKIFRSSRKLVLIHCNGLTNLEYHLSYMTNLNSLTLMSCRELESLSVNVVPSLEVLGLMSLPRLSSIWTRDYVPQHDRDLYLSLRQIKMFNCSGLKSVISSVLLPCLQNLEFIGIWECAGMEEIISGELDIGQDQGTEEKIGDENNTLSKLRSLELSNLPELRTICRSQLVWPSLVSITLDNCLNLKKLPRGLADAKNLSIIQGELELEWEDNDQDFIAKYILQSLFEPW
ncbi:hypothetical protein AMTRI_Chr02g214670 [Amborella trichopoda]